jgi:dGTPase
MADHGGFDHNRQSLRIVTKLEQRYVDYPGLNLTWEVREGIVKHESEYDVADARNYDADLRGHLEAQVVNAADELSYTAHDLDDGLHSGMIHAGMLEGISIWEILVESVGWRGGVLDDLSRHRMIRNLINMEVSDLIHATDQNLRQSGVRSPLELQRLAYNVVSFSEEMHGAPGAEGFPLQQPVPPPPGSAHGVKAERIVSDLFKAYQQDQPFCRCTSRIGRTNAGWSAPSAITSPG